MGRKKKPDKRDIFIQLVIKKHVDVGEVMMNETYNDYFDFIESYVGDIMDPEDVLEEEEFNLIKEIVEEYKEVK